MQSKDYELPLGFSAEVIRLNAEVILPLKKFYLRPLVDGCVSLISLGLLQTDFPPWHVVTQQFHTAHTKGGGKHSLCLLKVREYMQRGIQCGHVFSQINIFLSVLTQLQWGIKSSNI